MNAFDGAWDMLKALPEQQMFREAKPRGNAAQNLVSTPHRPQIDRFDARSYGTVHPAITSWLKRHRENQIPENEGFRYPILNLDLGEEEQKWLDNREQYGFDTPFWAMGRGIGRSPEVNMESYDAKRQYDYDDEEY